VPGGCHSALSLPVCLVRRAGRQHVTGPVRHYRQETSNIAGAGAIRRYLSSGVGSGRYAIPDIAPAARRRAGLPFHTDHVVAGAALWVARASHCAKP
jgi:hypothetical protein